MKKLKLTVMGKGQKPDNPSEKGRAGSQGERLKCGGPP